MHVKKLVIFFLKEKDKIFFLGFIWFGIETCTLCQIDARMSVNSSQHQWLFTSWNEQVFICSVGFCYYGYKILLSGSKMCYLYFFYLDLEFVSNIMVFITPLNISLPHCSDVKQQIIPWAKRKSWTSKCKCKPFSPSMRGQQHILFLASPTVS